MKEEGPILRLQRFVTQIEFALGDSLNPEQQTPPSPLQGTNHLDKYAQIPASVVIVMPLAPRSPSIPPRGCQKRCYVVYRA